MNPKFLVTLYQAISECSNNYKSLVEKVKLTGQRCQLSFKSKRKAITETITLEPGMFSKKTKNTIFTKTVGKIRTSRNFIQPKHECKMSYNRKTKEWFLILVEDSEKISENLESSVCSIDPGEKTFLTVYDPEGHVISIGQDNRNSKMFQKLNRIDELNSKKEKTKNKKIKRSLDRSIHRLYKKVKNLRDDLHKKACKFLCENFKNIVIPEYRSKDMLSKLNNDVSRSITSLSYYMFRKRLERKCSEYNCNLFLVTEEYTSRTCGQCGSLNKPKDRVYSCSKCNLEIHRDYNGARNILLKHL
jgi:IS605 OrfB family transposase